MRTYPNKFLRFEEGALEKGRVERPGRRSGSSRTVEENLLDAVGEGIQPEVWDAEHPSGGPDEMF